MSHDSASGPRVTILRGSVRPGNYTAMAAALVEDELRGRGIEVTNVDPTGLDLKLPGQPGSEPAVEALRDALVDADGVVFVTPEYHGGLSSVSKLLIENMGYPSVFATKPVALVGVAAGRIGAVKSLEMLQSILSHVGAIVLPGSVSVANVQKVFSPDGVVQDPEIEKRVRGVPARLLDFLETHVCPRASLEAMARDDS